MIAIELADIIGANVEDYLEDRNEYSSPTLTIGQENGEIEVHLVNGKRQKSHANKVVYNLVDLCIKDEFGMERPNYEVINRIAQEWTK